jgi:antibiotic biosynthesis monooxygenase (ABM) superfamily enzyme
MEARLSVIRDGSGRFFPSYVFTGRKASPYRNDTFRSYNTATKDLHMTAAARPPSRIRLALFVFLGVYPLVTALIYALGPLTAGWEIWQRNLVMVPIIVITMIWVIIPRIHRHCGRWL